MSSRLQTQWRAFSLPKRGHRLEEYEDAYAVNPDSGRFAVADGAAESSFANVWARLLVSGFVRITEGKTAGSWLAPLQRRWAAQVNDLELPWYAEEKRDLGAFATLLGLTIRPPQNEQGGRWTAVAIGDSCLFQVRHERLLGAFPLNHAADFGNQPPLIGSRAVPSSVVGLLKQARGQWQPGDRFYLMTDALAQWFLRRCEADHKPSVASRLAEPEPALATYMERLRDQNEMKNDDITLLSIDV
jgi:hypothetical protein